MSIGGTGNISNYLKTVASVESPFQYDDDPESSAFVKQGYYTSTPHIDSRYIIKPQTQYSDYQGQLANIRIEKDHDFGGLCEIQIPSSAVTASNVPTYLARANWFAFTCINEIYIKHNTHTLQSWQGDTMFPHYILESDAAKREAFDPLIGGDYSLADRHTMAAKPMLFHAPLDLFGWWCKNTHTYMNTQSYSDELRVIVSFRQKSDIIQTDALILSGAATVTHTLGTVTIADKTYELGLVMQQHHVVESERVWHHNKILNEGLLEPYVDYVNVGQDTKDPNQNNFFKTELKNLNMPVRHLAWTYRKATDLTTPYQKNYYNYLTVVGYGGTGQSSGGEFIPFTPSKYHNLRQRDQYHSSIWETAIPIYHHTFSYVPEDHINDLGTLHMGNITNPELVSYIGQSVGDSSVRDASRGDLPGQTAPEQIIVDVYAQTFNMRQEFGGTPKRVFG